MESLKCPGCATEMETKQEADLTSDLCNSCGGVFLDKGELNDLVTGMSGDIEFCSIDSEFHKDQFPHRVCPRCENQKMNKINLLRLSEVVFDYCPKCQGFFFDRNELELTNRELRTLSGDGKDVEIRESIDGRLLRVDKIDGATLITDPKKAGEISAVETTTYKNIIDRLRKLAHRIETSFYAELHRSLGVKG